MNNNESYLDRLFKRWFEEGCPTSWYPLDDEIVEESVDKP